MKKGSNIGTVAHSNWQSARTGEVGFFDLFDLCGAPDAAYSFVQQLMARAPQQLDMEVDFERNRGFLALHLEARNVRRNTGQTTVGIGFPRLLVPGASGEMAAMPVFVWPALLEPDAKDVHGWHLSVLPEAWLRVNPVLAARLRHEGHAPLLAELEALAQAPSLPAARLSDLGTALSDALGLPASDASINLMAAGDAERALAESGGGLSWSALLGLYPAQAVAAAEVETDWRFWQEAHPEVDGHSFGPLPLDPWQAVAWRSILQRRLTLVSGGSGTGKTHLLVNTLANVLSRGGRCLVVANNKHALERAQKQMALLGLGEWVLGLSDELNDRAVLAEMLRAKARVGGSGTAAAEQLAFRQQLGRLQREEEKLGARYRASRKPAYDVHNWHETLGLYLRSARTEGKEVLESYLHEADFAFHAQEHDAVQAGIASCLPLFDRIGTFNHPLQNLNSAIFIHNTEADGQQFIATQVGTFLEKATELQQRYIAVQTQYSDKLTEHYEAHYRHLSDKVEQLKDLLTEARSRFDEDTLSSGSGTLKLYGAFSGKFRDALDMRQQLAAAYGALQRQHGEHRYFEHSFLPEKSQRKLSLLQEDVQLFDSKLHNWRESLYANIQEELLRLSHKTVEGSLGLKDKVLSIELALDHLVEELNGSGLYQLPMESNMLTLPRRQKCLEDMVERLEETRYHLRDYAPFYEWQHNWFSLPAVARKAVKALVKARPADWGAAFESWYLHHALSHHYDAGLPSRDYPLGQYAALSESIRAGITAEAHAATRERSELAAKAFKRSHRDMHEAIFARRESPALPDMLAGAGLDAVLASFPVLLLTAELAAQLRPATQPIFEYLLVEGAQGIDASLAEALLPLAQRAVAFTTQEQELPGSNALPEILRYHRFADIELGMSHLLSPGSLSTAQVAQAAIGPRTVHFEQLNGRYDEQEQTNEEEAHHIIRLLNQVQPKPGNTFPSVGIVCFTQPQRDLILQSMMQIKRQRATGVEMVQQLERNGLAVLHLEELQGHRFDILIISATYGMNGAHGALTQHLRALNTPARTAQLHTLMGLAESQLFLVNSVPWPVLEAMAVDEDHPGNFWMANYFCYVKALETGNGDEQLRLVQRVGQQGRGGTAPAPGHFAAQVAATLSPLLPKGWRVVLDVPDVCRLPLVVYTDRPEAPKVALLVDGFLAETPMTDFYWEYTQQKELLAGGYALLPLWSALWWKHPAREAQGLVARMMELGVVDEGE